jgi:DNA-binding NarL/FixJ family response regulator
VLAGIGLGRVVMAPSRHLGLRLVVASEHALVAESVRAALSGRASEVVAIGWPDATSGTGWPAQATAFDAGLLVSDLARWSRLRAVELLLTQVPTRWVVLTDAPRGAPWGLVAGGGAVAVLPTSTPLDDVAAALVAAAAGALAVDGREREQLVAEWRQLRASRADLGARVATLTGREREVLRMLYAGDSVGRIAELLEVSPATVRSQVKAVLRKLHVSSQLAAVAELSTLLEGEGEDVAAGMLL